MLSKWVVDVAEAQGYLVQYTSIPGVAQRTGATTYYLELFPRPDAEDGAPVMALTPGPGDVDVLLASEIVEAGCMIERGFISPERSTVIFSNHRVYAISEKGAIGDGRADVSQVVKAAGEMSKKLVQFDMARLARETGSVINAVLLGALAGSRALPFPRAAYEDAIRSGGIAVEANLAGFKAGFDVGAGAGTAPSVAVNADGERPPARSIADLERSVHSFPGPTQYILTHGVSRLLDYQDRRYAETYLERMEAIAELDRKLDGDNHGFALTNETGRHLALWMSFEDVIRVADLKIRSGRMRQVRDGLSVGPDQPVHVFEFLKPGVEELGSILPAWLARRILGSPKLTRMIGRFTRGRKVRTTTVTGFLSLWLLARLKRWRRGTYRYSQEHAVIERWLEHVKKAASDNYALGLEVAECARLVKGYGETNRRGVANFNRIMTAIGSFGLGTVGTNGAALVHRLRDAALADEEGSALTRALDELSRGNESGHIADRA